MSYIHPLAAEHLRRRWLKPDWQRWMREDAHRWMPPGIEADAARSDRADDAVFADELTRLQQSQECLQRLVVELKYEFAWRRLCRKYGYNPNQPRVPAGSGVESGR